MRGGSVTPADVRYSLGRRRSEVEHIVGDRIPMPKAAQKLANAPRAFSVSASSCVAGAALAGSLGIKF